MAVRCLGEVCIGSDARFEWDRYRSPLLVVPAIPLLTSGLLTVVVAFIRSSTPCLYYIYYVFTLMFSMSKNAFVVSQGNAMQLSTVTFVECHWSSLNLLPVLLNAVCLAGGTLWVTFIVSVTFQDAVIYRCSIYHLSQYPIVQIPLSY